MNNAPFVPNKYSFIIPGTLPNMNDIIAQAQRNRFGYGVFKKKWTALVSDVILFSSTYQFKEPIALKVHWFEKNKRRDPDNIQAGVKFILDAMVHRNLIPNDTQEFVRSITHTVEVDSKNPRIVVQVTKWNVKAPDIEW